MEKKGLHVSLLKRAPLEPNGSPSNGFWEPVRRGLVLSLSPTPPHFSSIARPQFSRASPEDPLSFHAA